ncbi:SGNH hydrolase [Lentithecium fluviatile CBS 122367]|uniref:SGNH hydrolase n=1 Tax=Lentithecium fluviatile CBS 122367 TaxID=1168545 RepID=A0A6G1IMA4_9PLEO|nr:SGNH hydrolase [Lentithecium fluviatile CBS 122367]
MLLTSLVLFFAALIPSGTADQFVLHSPPARPSWIRKMASIGDSYSAGLGAGTRIDFYCSRYALSYPNILRSYLFGGNERKELQFLSCSGATSTEILENQVPKLDEDIDLLTISAGGNDIGLTPILSNCIYQFYMSGEDECEKSIQEARERITDESQLYRNLIELIDAVKPKVNYSHGVIYVTGYAGFFGVDDETCDNVTWAVWNSVESKKQYLTLELRQALEDLVRSVNRVLFRAVRQSGPNVRFVDYDEHIKAARGRYCESGVQEPAPNRPELAFYEWSTVDPSENKTALQNETGGDVPKGSFESGIAERINKTLQEHPDWEFDPDKGFVNKTRDGMGEEGVVEDTIHWMLPDAWKRVFHLRPEGHQIIARLILKSLEREGMGRANWIRIWRPDAPALEEL